MGSFLILLLCTAIILGKHHGRSGWSRRVPVPTWAPCSCEDWWDLMAPAVVWGLLLWKRSKGWRVQTFQRGQKGFSCGSDRPVCNMDDLKLIWKQRPACRESIAYILLFLFCLIAAFFSSFLIFSPLPSPPLYSSFWQLSIFYLILHLLTCWFPSLLLLPETDRERQTYILSMRA